MTANGIEFQVVYSSSEEANRARVDIEKKGGTAEVKEEAGLLPLAVLLAVVIPPGAALLIGAISAVVKEWTDDGVIIDARGTGDPRIKKEGSLPYGTVIILTRDGDESQRSDIPREKLSEYIGAALTALSGGASASDATKEASDQSGVEEGEKAS